MPDGARTPEELETLLEDAILLRDREGVARLFEREAVLAHGRPPSEIRGRSTIAGLLCATRDDEHPYLAESRHVIQLKGSALVIGTHAVHVLHRGRDGMWLYRISILLPLLGEEAGPSPGRDGSRPLDLSRPVRG